MAVNYEQLFKRKRRKREEQDEDMGFGEWGGYMKAKWAKLVNQYDEQVQKECEKKSDIFKGIAIFVNGYTKPPAEQLKIMMAEHGGTYHGYQVSETTHIIASNLPNVKITKLGSTPIVKPDWISESITMGRLLDFSNYLLYTNQNRLQPRLNFKAITKDEACNEQPGPSAAQSTTKTASDPKFLAEFYNNSRLHLISTLGAEFKQLVNDMRSDKEHKFPGMEKISKPQEIGSEIISKNPIVMHIDMDCFFVSVGLRNRPDLRGKPVAVTHSKGGNVANPVDRSAEIALYKERLPDGAVVRLESIDNNSSLSEIASCSYEARRCGIKNGMFMGTALKLCPDLKAIPYDFQGYREVSFTLYKTIAEYTLDIEAVSCDEMYVDVSKILQKSQMNVEEWASHIREEISKRTGCPCSTGFGANRLQARLATKRAKPNGQYYLRPELVEDYISETSLKDLPGVGRATVVKLRNIGLETCGDLQAVSLSTLQKELGTKAGETIYEQSRGIDKKPLQYEHERKSVSAEVNYGIRFKTIEEAHNFFESLSFEVFNRLKETGLRTKCVTLKLMIRAEAAPVETAKFLGHGVCDSLSKSSTLGSYIDSALVILKEVKSLYQKLNLNFEDLRGVGIQLSKLEKGPVLNGVMKSFLETSTKKGDEKLTSVINAPKAKDEITKSLDIHSNVQLDNKKTESPPGGRGRPKGSKNSKKSNKLNNTNSLSNYFKSTQKIGSGSRQNKLQYSGIDMSVLKELPEKIRNEVINEYNLNKNVQHQSSETSSNKKNNAENVLDKPQASNSIKIKDPTFDGLNYNDFRTMLEQWLETETSPLQFDVIMLANYFKKMAIDRKIEKLHILIKFLHRRINQKEHCDWHEAYFSIINLTQEGMIMQYGNALFIPRSFNCILHGKNEKN